MGLYARLARLRPGGSIADVEAIITPRVIAPKLDTLTVNGCVKIRFDANRAIGAIRFNQGFPTRVEIEGLTLGMPLDALLRTRSFGAGVPLATGRLETRSATLPGGGALTAYIDRANTLHSFEIANPAARFPAGGDATNATVLYNHHDDSNEMLRDWVEDAASDEEHDTFKRYAQWLATVATADDRHASALSWNWDGDLIPLFWIIRQPDCERATAFGLFYLGDPGSYIDELAANAPSDDPGYALIREIRQRAIAGFYRNAEIGFDGEATFAQWFSPAAREAPAALEAVPPLMRSRIEGRKAASDGDFAEGMPASLWD